MVKVTVNSTPTLSYSKIVDLIGDFGDPADISGSSKKIVADFGGGDSVTLGGDNFKFAGSVPYKGTVKSLDIEIDGKERVTVSGLKLDVSKVANEVKDGDLDGLLDLLNKQLSGRDYIKGGSGKDTLYGFGGDDKLYGRAGNDKLFGGSGDDTFVFATALDAKHNVDKILDFKSADDSFSLAHTVFKTLEVGELAKSEFKVIKSATPGNLDSNDRILYDKAHGDVYFDRDGSGEKYGLVKFAEVTNGTSLSHSDFLIF